MLICFWHLNKIKKQIARDGVCVKIMIKPGLDAS